VIDDLYSITLVALALVAATVIIMALRNRRPRSPLDQGTMPAHMPIAVVAPSARRARRWAQQQRISRNRYYFVDSVDDLQPGPCFYVPVDGYDQREDWPMLYAELAARGYTRWWPPVKDAQADLSE
jgi:hypothetical protein